MSAFCISKLIVPTVAPVVSDLRITSGDMIVIGEAVEMACSVSGVPVPLVSWERDGVDLTSALDIIINQTMISNNSLLSVLRISESDIQDDGEYTCRGFNHVGNSSLTIKLELLGKQKIYCLPVIMDIFTQCLLSLRAPRLTQKW